MRGGKSIFTLPAGYLGSSFIGALLTMQGFNVVASKVASIVLGVCFLLTLWWGKRDWLTIGTILLAVGLLVACWFIAEAQALKYVVLFIGVMSSLYSVWDIVRFSCSHFIFSFWLRKGRIYDVLTLRSIKTVRRSHPTKNQQLGRERFRQALWRLEPVLGNHLVYYQRHFYGWRHPSWHCGISTNS